MLIFTEDLWNSLEWASDKPVERVMRTWTEKMGFPVLTVSEKKVSRLIHINVQFNLIDVF